MASPQHNLNSQELQPYGEDVFDEFLDLDFLRNNNAMEEEVDIDAMSNSDLFRYFLEGELVKDAPAMSTEDLKLGVLTTPTPLTPVSPFADMNEITQQPSSQQTITNTASVAPSLAVLNAQLAELLAKLPLIKQEPITDNKLKSSMELQIPKTISNSRSGGSSIASPSSPPPTQNNQHHSSTSTETRNDVDLKKLTSKERRQLRNKISARNFRVRRKEYISNLESTNQQQEEEINLLRQALTHLQEENSKLQEEVKELRKQQKKQSNTSYAASSPHLTPKDVSNGVNLALLKNNNVSNNTRSSSSSSSSNNNRLLVIPNINKDTPSSPSQSQPKWGDTRVRVQTTFIPEFSLDKQMFMDKSPNYSNYFGYNPSPASSMFVGEDGQMTWIAYLLFSTLAQQISSLFNQNEEEFLISSIEQERENEDVNDNIEASSSSSLLDNNLLVENAKEASVLDWLYDTMVRHVVEQSQVEARMHELQSDWVGDDELEDNVLPYLF
ncbi:11745_t:CDS:2 [Ambispora leptoticha]|uniref:11745_t:CDS:1 n=1 Tax=Ambispora leptoticha TaxID=144679 RepID=A0A9N9EXB5_9GLOM|nr:11745_t:CDS:2 [Ambispora leptoticha]